jgi:predicted RNA binding protein YcfA (HicA-like mRNA interferase family)
MKVREVLAALAEDGWIQVRTRGSHRQLKHPIKRGLVTVAGKASLDLHEGTIKSIFKQAQLIDPRKLQ